MACWGSLALFSSMLDLFTNISSMHGPKFENFVLFFTFSSHQHGMARWADKKFLITCFITPEFVT